MLAERIQTYPDNYTRFGVLSRSPEPIGEPDKTSLVFGVGHVAGSLFRCLGAFAERHVSLTKLESRPRPGRPWEYVFYVDVDAAAARPEMVEALAALSEHATFTRVLGDVRRGRAAARPRLLRRPCPLFLESRRSSRKHVGSAARRQYGPVAKLSSDESELIVRDAAAWRAWLAEHHAEPDGVWLVLAKKGTVEPTSLGYDDALEEALCHGWIDGQVERRDETTYKQRFTPRRKRSPWSKRNVGIAERLVAEGRMHAGRARRDRAREVGRPLGGRVRRAGDDRGARRISRRRSRRSRRRRRCSSSSRARTATRCSIA